MKVAKLLILSALISLLTASAALANQLQWFGYVAGVDQDVWLDGTRSYANWGWVVTDASPSSTLTTDRVNALAQRNMKGIIELGSLLWSPEGDYRGLYLDYATRWQTWKNANASVLNSTKVLAFLVRDEPFHNQVDIHSFEIASQMVRHDFPWAKLILIEAARDVACADDPGCWFNQYSSATGTFDWIGADKYAIHPSTDTEFQNAVAILKQTYPGRKTLYAADGWWESAHADAFLAPISVMRDVMTEWYGVASADPDAVLLGVFLFAPVAGWTTCRDFPPSVLEEQTRIGRLITGRTRGQLYQPTGVLERIGTDRCARGWACDPDGAWGERILVDLYVNGSSYYPTYADQASELFPQCRTGIAHRFQVCANFALGSRITAWAHDLDSGLVQLPANCLDAPACVMYSSNYRPTGSFEGITAAGVASGWACDKDSPPASIRIQVQTADPSSQTVGTYTANLASEAAVNTACGGGAAHRFSVQLPLWTKGKYLAVYGLDVMEGSAFLVTSGPSCPTIGYCTW
jgi:hypothetical protein